ncbi:hypothetical protein EZS27_012996 [termite gut metagenome]|uniref:Uncharacterized protein n=1 Tax=termite gut metagenome TaxID=433724 RepID=A0A5J4RYY5_9ZZZZ
MQNCIFNECRFNTQYNCLMIFIFLCVMPFVHTLLIELFSLQPYICESMFDFK